MSVCTWTVRVTARIHPYTQPHSNPATQHARKAGRQAGRQAGKLAASFPSTPGKASDRILPAKDAKDPPVNVLGMKATLGKLFNQGQGPSQRCRDSKRAIA